MTALLVGALIAGVAYVAGVVVERHLARSVTRRDDEFARRHRVDAHAGRGEWADQ